MRALLEADTEVVPRVIEKVGFSPSVLREGVDKVLASRPSVSGPGYDSRQVGMTRRFSAVIVAAEDLAAQLRDEFVSVEHLALVLDWVEDDPEVYPELREMLDELRLRLARYGAFEDALWERLQGL